MKAEKRMAIVQLQCMVKYNILFENEMTTFMTALTGPVAIFVYLSHFRFM